MSRNTCRLYATHDHTSLSETMVKSSETPSAAAFSVFPRIQDVRLDDLLGNESFEKGTYFVSRSSTGNLPVYSDFKAGGNKIVTEIRKIHGDIIQLRNDMQKELPSIPKESWKVVMQSKKIVIKGDFVRDVKNLLGQRF